MLVPANQSFASETKCLIEFGWDEPDTRFLRAHIGELQQSPFAGCVFHADFVKKDGSKGSFTWQAWGQQEFKNEDLQSAFQDLASTQFGKFGQNFLRFNTTPGRLDWFDDHSAVVANAMLAARLALTGRGPGILFDIEQYEGPLFDYKKQRDASSKSFDLYAKQARQRGREVMDAFQRGYPGLTVLLTFGYSLPWAESSDGRRSLADCKYGLLAPFLDGMLEGVRGRARLIDGYERSYGYKTAEQFAVARKTMKQDLLSIVAQPDKYRRFFSIAFGIWLDHDWRKRGWNTEDPAKNYFSPASLEQSVTEALRATDEYVWIYSETPRWWSREGKPEKLPEEYGESLRRALLAR